MSEDEGAADRRQVQMFITAVAGYVADKTRERQEQVQRAAAESAERSRAAHGQLAAERASAQAMWQPTLQSQWWSQATVIDVQRAYQAAAEWAPFDESAAHAAELIAQRVGVDTAELGGQPVESVEAIAQARHLAPEAAADAHNAEWDSRVRRAASSASLAESARVAGLSGEVAAEAVEAERIADLGQAQPAHAAVATSVSHSSARSTGVDQMRGRVKVARPTR